MALETLVAPATEPVTLQEARAFLRIGTDGDDTLIQSLIIAAREAMEARTGRALVSRTLRQRFVGPRIAGTILPGRAPVISLTQVRTMSADGVEAVAPLDLVKLVDGRFWLARNVSGLSIDYVAGFGAAGNVPQAYKIALLEAVADAIARRDGESVRSVFETARAWEQAFGEVKL